MPLPAYPCHYTPANTPLLIYALLLIALLFWYSWVGIDGLSSYHLIPIAIILIYINQSAYSIYAHIQIIDNQSLACISLLFLQIFR